MVEQVFKPIPREEEADEVKASLPYITIPG